MNRSINILIAGFFLFALLYLNACKKDTDDGEVIITDSGITIPDSVEYNTDPYIVNIPLGVPPMLNNPDNPLTIEGVKLGRMLFYDPILSDDSTQSCSSCHNYINGFTDNGERFSTGIHGDLGNRNAMPTFNLAFNTSFFWDGRSETPETQALEPVKNPIEMDEEWSDNIVKLKRSEMYVFQFYRAFGTVDITKEMAAGAIAQFERSIVSFDSKFDKALRGEGGDLTESEQRGAELLVAERNSAIGLVGGDCFHCHGSWKNFANMLFTDNDFHNNGLDSVGSVFDFADYGLGEVTGDETDYGLFRTPTLRNIALTGPYMHDGRFETLKEVIEFYNAGGNFSPTVDPNMKHRSVGLGLSAQQIDDMVAFLHTLTDSTILTNPAYQSPFE